MNPDPLVNFLRQYSPTAPPPHPGLEARILTGTRPQPRPVWHWFPPVMAVAGLSLWLGVASAQLFQPSPAQVADIEAWVEASWQGQDEFLALH